MQSICVQDIAKGQVRGHSKLQDQTLINSDNLGESPKNTSPFISKIPQRTSSGHQWSQGQTLLNSYNVGAAPDRKNISPFVSVISQRSSKVTWSKLLKQ